MHVRIRGSNLPGRTFTSDGQPLGNVHVAVQIGADAVDPVPGDATTGEWSFEVRTAVADDGGLDVRGPAVHGKRGERFFYLTWGDVAPDGGFAMFRRAKLMVGSIDAELLGRAASDDDLTLTADVDLTDDRGGPRCARVHPPAIRWSVG